jgi:hypothetical protein
VTPLEIYSGPFDDEDLDEDDDELDDHDDEDGDGGVYLGLDDSDYEESPAR